MTTIWATDRAGVSRPFHTRYCVELGILVGDVLTFPDDSSRHPGGGPAAVSRGKVVRREIRIGQGPDVLVDLFVERDTL